MRFDEDTLYVTDLDGTLLGKDARIPQKAVEMLNEMLDSGLPFTVATARSWASAGPMMIGNCRSPSTSPNSMANAPICA